MKHKTPPHFYPLFSFFYKYIAAHQGMDVLCKIRGYKNCDCFVTLLPSTDTSTQAASLGVSWSGLISVNCKKSMDDLSLILQINPVALTWAHAADTLHFPAPAISVWHAE